MLLRKTIRMLLPLVLAATFVGTMASAAQADNTIPSPTSWVEIYPPYFNTGAPKCLDNANGSNSSGNAQQVYHCHGYASNGTPQRWQLFNRGTSDNPYYEIRNVGSNLCLYASGASIVQEPCNLQFAGLWFFNVTPNVGPYFALQNLGFPGTCLATQDSSGNDHTGVTITTCNYNNQSDPTWIRQVWSFG